MTDVELFQSHRAGLLSLAYRMLGEFGKAEDIVQDAWLRWQRRRTDVDAPKAYLVKTVTRLCLNELDAARSRKEELRADRLPEPVSVTDTGIARVEALDRISMAFVMLLQRLTPAERAVFLLREVFDFEHAEVAELVGKKEAACRQLLKRAREHVATERRALVVSEEVHRRLLRAFMQAAATGDVEGVAQLLAEDAVLIADAGPEGGSYGRVRNLPGPIAGARKVAAFVARVTPQGSTGLSVHECELNGQPAVLVLRDEQPFAAILLSVVNDKICNVFIHADPERLRHVGKAPWGGALLDPG